MADKEAPVTLRTRKFLSNPLLGRKQMVVYVFPLSTTPVHDAIYGMEGSLDWDHGLGWI